MEAYKNEISFWSLFIIYSDIASFIYCLQESFYSIISVDEKSQIEYNQHVYCDEIHASCNVQTNNLFSAMILIVSDKVDELFVDETKTTLVLWNSNTSELYFIGCIDWSLFYCLSNTLGWLENNVNVDRMFEIISFLWQQRPNHKVNKRDKQFDRISVSHRKHLGKIVRAIGF